MPDRSEILALADAWMAAIEAGDPARVVALYADDAILLPTTCNRLLRSPAEIRDYFAGFLVKSPSGRIRESAPRILSDTSATQSGVYSFEITVDGKRSEFLARFTFIYQRRPHGWRIVEHHSSLMPEVSVA